ncbi:MAG: hypothetical protein R3346_04545 [Candidatus Spechtbacterales bacterium]|nr:hypothetical protein [Candidatus Spechtbacterales bacterium]
MVNQKDVNSDSCGCGGTLSRHGCNKYLESEELQRDVEIETSLGFVSHSIARGRSPEQIMMLKHLQMHDTPYDEALGMAISI